MQSMELCWSVAIIPGTDDIMLMLSLTIIPNIESYNNSNPLSSARIRFCTLSLDDKNVQNWIVKTSREWLWQFQVWAGSLCSDWGSNHPQTFLSLPSYLLMNHQYYRWYWPNHCQVGNCRRQTQTIESTVHPRFERTFLLWAELCLFHNLKVIRIVSFSHSLKN